MVNPDLESTEIPMVNVSSSELFNSGGGVNDTTQWKWNTFKIPALPAPGFRVRLRATFPTGNGIFGLDNVKIVTDQQCQPRYRPIRGIYGSLYSMCYNPDVLSFFHLSDLLS